MPTEKLYDGIMMIDFANSTTWKGQTLGRKDGTDAVKLGETWFVEQMDAWRDQPDIQSAFPDLGDYIEFAR